MGRRGRPFSADPRKKHYMIRINDQEDQMLDECCKMTGMGQADVFRVALERLHKEELEKKDIRDLCVSKVKKKLFYGEGE